MSDPAATASVSIATTSVRLGDVLPVTIEVRHPLFLIPQNPTMPRSTFEVRASTGLPVEAGPETAISRFRYELQNFTTGPQLLPAITVPYRDPMGRTFTLKTSSLTIQVTDVPADPGSADIRGIRGVVGPVAWSAWWVLLAALLLLGAGAALWRFRRRVQQGPPPPPPEAADARARRRLAELLSDGDLDAGRIKEFYSELSEILREYLENAFHVDALERTTSEIQRQLRKKSDWPSDRQQQLQALLEACDLVKFAKFRPDAAEALAAHAGAVQFIDATAKPPHEPR